jgi:hypothetical protein
MKLSCVTGFQFLTLDLGFKKQHFVCSVQYTNLSLTQPNQQLTPICLRKYLGEVLQKKQQVALETRPDGHRETILVNTLRKC